MVLYRRVVLSLYSSSQRERDAMLLASKLGEVGVAPIRGGRLPSPLAGRGLLVVPLRAWLVPGWLSCTTVGEAPWYLSCGAPAAWLAYTAL